MRPYSTQQQKGDKCLFLPWVKMPSKAFSNSLFFLNQMSDDKDASTDAAALKLFIYFCLFSEHYDASESAHKDICFSGMSSTASYQDMQSKCGISKHFASKGVKKLMALGLLIRKGKSPNFEFIIKMDREDRWCKLPKRCLLTKKGEIKPFLDMSSTHKNERDALKVFIYLLAIKHNQESITNVSVGKISQKTGVAPERLDSVVSTLYQSGLLSSRSSASYSNTNNIPIEKQTHSYKLIGSDSLASLPKCRF
jgi:Mn-dependent DtxR family transcriptional regulator